MKMLIAVTTLALTLAVPALLRAQPPDLSGTWTMDEARSDPAPAAPVGRAAAGGGRGGRGGGLPANQIAIAQTPTEVTITQGPQNVTYKVDGTETFYFQNGEIRATGAWDGTKLVISWKRELYAGPAQGYVTTTGKDTYSLAGNVLNVDRSTTTPQGTTSRRVVYNKT